MPPPKTTVKKIHIAKFVDQHGNASALCFKVPHAINMKRESWRLATDNGANCEECLRLDRERISPSAL